MKCIKLQFLQSNLAYLCSYAESILIEYFFYILFVISVVRGKTLVIEQIHDVSLNPLSRSSLSNSNNMTTWNRQLRECRSSKFLFWNFLYHNLVIIPFLIWTKTFSNFLYCRTEHSWKTNFEQDLITEHTIAEQKKMQHIDSIKMFFLL